MKKEKELKTLKDLEEESVKEYGFDIATLRHLSWVLKAEAIKWVKWFSFKNEITNVEMSNVARAFKEFFNLTEEDLSSKDNSGEPK